MSRGVAKLFLFAAAGLFLACSSLDNSGKGPAVGIAEPVLLVSTAYGKIRGAIDDGVRVWRGIRYAKAPVGALRFKAPVPVEKWEGVKDAVEFGPVCPQALHLQGRKHEFENQSEDCLFLNVWAPKSAKNAPVMVWYHGGAYVFGAGSFELYNGARLARQGGVIVVTLNYRVGPFGCMHFDDLAEKAGIGAEFDDNPGLRDQVAALQWVRANIAAFGGNPGNITIFGESAGASSVVALLCTPSAKGLFHRAIAQSPSPVSIYSRKTGDDYAVKLLAYLGLKPDEAGRLKEVNADALAKAAVDLLHDNARDMPGSLPFGPTDGTEYFPNDPYTAASKGEVARVPLIIGTNRDESTLFDTGKYPLLPIKQVQIERMLDFIDPSAKQRVLSMYDGYPSKKSRLEIAADVIFRQSTIQFADLYGAHAPTWAYRFDYVSPTLKLARYGATHGSEVVHVFQTYSSKEGRLVTLLNTASTQNAMGDLMQNAWLSFARTGVPVVKGAAAGWGKYDSKERLTCILDEEVRMVSDPDPKRRQAWTGVGRYK